MQMVDRADDECMHFQSALRWRRDRWLREFVVFMRLCLQLAHVFAFLRDHLQIPVRHARAGVGSGIASRKDLGPAGSGDHDASDDPSFMQKFIGVVVRAISLRCEIHTGPKRHVRCRLIQARPCRPSPHRHRSFRTFTRSTDFNRRSRCLGTALP